MITINVAPRFDSPSDKWKSDDKRHFAWKGVPHPLMPDLCEKVGRIEGLLYSLNRFPFEGSIIASVTREGCSVTGTIQTSLENLEEQMTPTIQEMEECSREICQLFKNRLTVWYEVVLLIERKRVETEKLSS